MWRRELMCRRMSCLLTILLWAFLMMPQQLSFPVSNVLSRLRSLVLCCTCLWMFTGVDSSRPRLRGLRQRQKPTTSRKNAKGQVPAKRQRVRKRQPQKRVPKSEEPLPSVLKGALLYNQYANKIVLTKSVGQQIPPASLTKILAMYVALDYDEGQRGPCCILCLVSAKAASARGLAWVACRGEGALCRFIPGHGCCLE